MMYSAILGQDGTLASSFGPCKEYALDAAAKSMGIQSNSLSVRDNVSFDLVDAVTDLVGRAAENSLKFLHQLEDALGIPKSELKFKEIPNVVSNYVGHKDWFLAPPMLSLYYLALRSGAIYQGGSWDEFLKRFLQFNRNNKYGALVSTRETHEDAVLRHDCGNWNAAYDGLRYLVKHGFKNVFGDDMLGNWMLPSVEKTYFVDDAFQIHQWYGIIGFTAGRGHPRWFRLGDMERHASDIVKKGKP